MVDAADLKSASLQRSVGSSPSLGIDLFREWWGCGGVGGSTVYSPYT